ncbi:Uncharacterized protein YloA [Babesia sp. Xinjiang]|nr:Uncharacterized protein YloA [Babesia sp. Xinjiang]ORM41642.1 Uncharacterized protein YloA [Babesia sp. Xinjiang]
MITAAAILGAEAVFRRRCLELCYVPAVGRNMSALFSTGKSSEGTTSGRMYSKPAKSGDPAISYPFTLNRCSRDRCISVFDRIKNDEFLLPPSTNVKNGTYKHLSLEFGMLRRYADELDHVFANATFMGVTHTPIKKLEAETKPLEALLLHFRGFERGDSICLFYQRDGFPLVPSPSASYIPASQRMLSYFEKVMSGLIGLRVSKVHCPYFFKNVIAIDLKAPHHQLTSEDGMEKPESYRILFVARRAGNRIVMADNNDGVILLTSATHDEKSGVKDGVGSVFHTDSSEKATPDPSEPFPNFMDRFKGKEHMSLLKAMTLTYEGIGPKCVTLLASKAGIDCTKHVSKIENVADFYDCYIRWLRAPDGVVEQLRFVTHTPSEDDTDAKNSDHNGDMGHDEPTLPTEVEVGGAVTDGSATGNGGKETSKSLIEYVFWHWGTDVPVYIHNRLAEETRTLIDGTVERFEKIKTQCIGDEQQSERLAKVQERLDSLDSYSKSLDTVMKWKSPEEFDLVKTINEQVYDLGDLTGYRRKGRLQREGRQHGSPDGGTEERNVRHFRPKKVNPYKGILVIKMNPGDPNTALIIVGRNAEQNERVTHEIALPGDVWLHTKDCPGSHVLLRRYGGSSEALQVAADIAAYYSKARARTSAPVIRTGIENVSRCAGAQIGAVLVNNYETLEGRPDRGGEYVKAHRISLN